MIHPEEPVYPDKDWGNNGSYGLTKREYFAAMAMQGILSNEELRKACLMDAKTEAQPLNSAAARFAVDQAEELIEALNKE